MALTADNIEAQIHAIKKNLRYQIGDYRGLFQELQAHMELAIERIQDLQSSQEAVPQIEFDDLNGIEDSTKERIRQAGCVVIRNTLPAQEVKEQDQHLEQYIVENGYYETEIDPELDQYFDKLAAGRPQIFGIYWSPTQIWARQHPHLAQARSFLNRLWKYETESQQHFDPDRECSYADRVRRREPGGASLGLSPHVDAGSVERWLDPNYRNVYRHLFNGNWQAYDPFDGAYRTQVQEIPSPAVCSMFRTFQGWTALTEQGPGDGTLMLVPHAMSIPYVLVRALQDDVPETELCGAFPRRALVVSEHWHPLLLQGLVSIPKMHPGDTVWWHPDTIHAVEEEHQGTGYSNVIYIGAAPWCEKNAAFLPKQAQAFLAGESCPDFSAEHHEVRYPNRAKLADLTSLGKAQMGLESSLTGVSS